MCTCSWLWGVCEPPAWAPEDISKPLLAKGPPGPLVNTQNVYKALYMYHQIYAPPRTRGPAPAHTIEVNLCTFSENNAAPHHPRSAAELAPALTILLWLYCFKYNVAPLPLPNDLLHLAPPMGPVARTQHKTLLLIWAGKCRGPCSRRRLLWLRWFQSLHRRSGRGTNTDRVPWQVGFSSSMMSIPGPVTSCIRQHMLNVRLILHRV